MKRIEGRVRRAVVFEARAAAHPWWKLGVRYGVWFILGALVLAWELLGVNAFRRVTGLGPRDHPPISQIVWDLERRFGVAGQGVVLVVMLDLTSHFVLHTTLIPGVG